MALKISEIFISAFDIYHKTIGKGNGKKLILTTAFDIRCNPEDSSLLKTLTVRCSEHHNNNLIYIPYRLLQMTNSKTYRRQIIFQNNYHPNLWRDQYSNYRQDRG